jgi:hypothetical protein
MNNIHPAINAAIVKQLSTAEQIQWAVSQNWTAADTAKAFGNCNVTRLKYVVEGDKLEVADGEVINKSVIKDAVTKAAVPPTTTANASALYYPSQAAGVLLPPISPSIISALVALGAPELPPNVRLLTQAANLSAVEVAEGAPVPAAAPSLGFSLTATDRKFALIVAYNQEMLAASNFDSRVRRLSTYLSRHFMRTALVLPVACAPD